MSNETNHANPNGHGSFEPRDIGSSGVLYFLLVLGVVCVITALLVNGLYHYLEARSEKEQAPVSPLVTNAPADTRHLSVDYRDYLKQNFPSPQLEIDERNQLDKDRTAEDETLATYGWIDENAGTVRIPIDRAMELVAQRGLPVRGQSPLATQTAKAVPEKMKGTK